MTGNQLCIQSQPTADDLQAVEDSRCVLSRHLIIEQYVQPSRMKSAKLAEVIYDRVDYHPEIAFFVVLERQTEYEGPS